MYSSPRRHHLDQAATTTLNEPDAVPPIRWENFKQPLPLILQTFQDLTLKNEDFWHRATPYFERKEYTGGTKLYARGDAPDGFFILEDGILRAEYDLPQGKYFESIVAATTCGELPFFSETTRTATVVAERDTVAWLLSITTWEAMQNEEPEIAQELLRLSLKLTSERMSAITS
jgi:SulP family sulfate permease